MACWLWQSHLRSLFWCLPCVERLGFHSVGCVPMQNHSEKKQTSAEEHMDPHWSQCPGCAEGILIGSRLKRLFHGRSVFHVSMIFRMGTFFAPSTFHISWKMIFACSPLSKTRNSCASCCWGRNHGAKALGKHHDDDFFYLTYVLNFLSPSLSLSHSLSCLNGDILRWCAC